MTRLSRLAEARRHVARWRKVLGIDPLWKIRVVEDESVGDGYLAAISYDPASYEARIGVYPAMLDATSGPDADIESTMVHELIHLVMSHYDGFADASAGNNDGLASVVEDAREMVVLRLEAALIGLSRAKWAV